MNKRKWSTSINCFINQKTEVDKENWYTAKPKGLLTNIVHAQCHKLNIIFAKSAHCSRSHYVIYEH